MTFWTWLTQHCNDSTEYNDLYCYLLDDENYCRRLMRYQPIYDHLYMRSAPQYYRETFNAAWIAYAKAQTEHLANCKQHTSSRNSKHTPIPMSLYCD